MSDIFALDFNEETLISTTNAMSNMMKCFFKKFFEKFAI